MAVDSNPTACLYTTILHDRARLQALRLDAACGETAGVAAHGPLFGVPVAVKDNIDIQGEPTSCGSRAFARPCIRDAAIVRQLDGLGAVIFAKTNLDEAALGASGRNEHFGRCRNPRGQDLLCGGSSSGSAAAVAMGHALLGIGTDTLGSVRIPAALCGVVGFKPSHDALSSDGVVPLYPAYDTVGLLAASLRDMTLACHALRLGAAAAVGARAEVPRISVLPQAVLAEIDLGVAAHYARCCDILRNSALVRVTESQPFDFLALARAALWEVSSQFAARVGFETPAFARSRAVLGAELRTLLKRASTLPSSALDGGRALLEDGRRRFAAHLADVDALLTPTCPMRAIDASAAVPKNMSAFLVPANVAGLPAICWPQTLAPSGCAKHPPGGEVGSLQLIGKAGRDRRLLDLAAMTQSLLAGVTAVPDTDHAGAMESPH